MHTIQIMLVEANSEAEAYERVNFMLTEHINPVWTDWHNAGGTPPFAGRWTGGVFLSQAQMEEIRKHREEPERGVEPVFTGLPDILCYADDPELAEYTLARFAGEVKQEMRECIPVGFDLDSLVQEYSSYSAESVHPPMAVYQLKRVLNLLSGEWTSDSNFYDLETGYATLAYFFERCKKEPHKQFLVPVDFHY